jgi:hypothetical protein
VLFLSVNQSIVFFVLHILPFPSSSYEHETNKTKEEKHLPAFHKVISERVLPPTCATCRLSWLHERGAGGRDWARGRCSVLIGLLVVVWLVLAVIVVLAAVPVVVVVTVVFVVYGQM